MKSRLGPNLLIVCLATSSLMTAACSSPSDPTAPTDGTVSLKLTSNGKPVVGMQVILQNESDSSEIGSGLSDANGAIVSTAFSGEACVTLINSANQDTFLYTLRDVKAGATLNIDIPLISPAKVGSLKYATPSAFAGANTYTVYSLANRTPLTDHIPMPLTPGTIRTLNVNEDAPKPNGKVTLLAVASQTVGSHSKPLAYSVLEDVSFTAGAAVPATTETFGAWQNNVTEVAVHTAGIPTGFTPDSGGAMISQFTGNNFFYVNATTAPANYTSAPFDYTFGMIPSLSNGYTVYANLNNVAHKSSIAMTRKSQVLPSLSNWNPSASGLPLASDITLDPTGPAASPRLKWTQAGSAIGVADVVKAFLVWHTGTKNFYWYAFSGPERADSGTYSYPALPAAFGANVPPPGNAIDFGSIIYSDFSNFDGYDAFLNEINLRFLGSMADGPATMEINMSGTNGQP